MIRLVGLVLACFIVPSIGGKAHALAALHLRAGYVADGSPDGPESVFVDHYASDVRLSASSNNFSSIRPDRSRHDHIFRYPRKAHASSVDSFVFIFKKDFGGTARFKDLIFHGATHYSSRRRAVIRYYANEVTWLLGAFFTMSVHSKERNALRSKT